MQKIICVIMTIMLLSTCFAGCSDRTVSDENSAAEETSSFMVELPSASAAAVSNTVHLEKNLNDFVSVYADVPQPQLPVYPTYKIKAITNDENLIKSNFFPNEEYELKKWPEGNMDFTGKSTGNTAYAAFDFAFSTNLFYSNMRDKDIKKVGKLGKDISSFSKQEALKILEEKMTQFCGLKIDKAGAEFYPINHSVMSTMWKELSAIDENTAKLQDPTGELTSEDSGYFIYAKFMINQTPIADTTLFIDALPANDLVGNSVGAPNIKAFVNKKGVQYLACETIFSTDGELEKYDAAKIISPQTALDSFQNYYTPKLSGYDGERTLRVRSVSLQYVPMPNVITGNKDFVELVPAWAFDGTESATFRTDGVTRSCDYNTYVDAITGKVIGHSETPYED